MIKSTRIIVVVDPTHSDAWSYAHYTKWVSDRFKEPLECVGIPLDSKTPAIEAPHFRMTQNLDAIQLRVLSIWPGSEAAIPMATTLGIRLKLECVNFPELKDDILGEPRYRLEISSCAGAHQLLGIWGITHGGFQEDLLRLSQVSGVLAKTMIDRAFKSLDDSRFKFGGSQVLFSADGEVLRTKLHHTQNASWEFSIAAALTNQIKCNIDMSFGQQIWNRNFSAISRRGTRVLTNVSKLKILTKNRDLILDLQKQMHLIQDQPRFSSAVEIFDHGNNIFSATLQNKDQIKLAADVRYIWSEA